MIKLRLGAGICFALAAVLSGLGGTAAARGANDLQMRIDDCDAAAHPRIVCRVAVHDANGKFVDDLTDRAFTVSFDEQPVASVRIAPTETAAANSHLMLVLDDGLTNRSRSTRTWRAGAEALLTSLPTGHGVTMLFASQAYEGLVQQSYVASEDRFAMIDVVRSHVLLSGARLYDSVCAAAGRVPFSRRSAAVWISVVGDGLDRGSTVCDARQAVQTVVHTQTPALVIGVGPYAGELRRLAAESNGLFVMADDAEAVVQAADAVMRRARARYAVEFVVDRPADGRAHTVAVGVRVGSETAQDAIDVDALPLAPALLGLEWSSDGVAVSERRLPVRGRVRVEPRFVGRGASAAEFVLDGLRTRIETAPFAYEFDATTLSHDTPSVLSVTLYGPDGATAESSQLIVGVAADGTAAAYRLDPDGAGVRAWLAGSAASLATGTASALLLGAALAYVVRRPQRGWTWRTHPQARAEFAAHGDAAAEAVTLVQASETRAGALRLRVRAPDGASFERVVRGPAVVGRRVEGMHVEIAVASGYVSLRHARFAPHGDGWRIEDLHSVNGVRRNGRMLAPGAAETIAVGDCIQCADVRIDVEDASTGGDRIDRGEIARRQAHIHGGE